MGAGLFRRAVELLLGAADLSALVQEQADGPGTDPLGLAAALVDWANRRAGHDNITVALARVSIRPEQPRKARTMATFSAEVYQNEFLPDGGSDVHAIVTVTCEGAGEAGRSGSGDAGEIVIVDTSGSMGEDKITAAKHAAAAALDQVLDGVWFAVIAGNHEARLAYPIAAEPGMVRMDDRTRAEAKRAIGDFSPAVAPPWAPGCGSRPRCSRPCRDWPRSTRSC